MYAIQRSLNRLLAQAQARPGVKTSAPLFGALNIDCKVAAERVYVQIWRPHAWPSLQDWAVVGRHWPQPFLLRPQRARQGERCYLWACLSPQPAAAAPCAPAQKAG